MWKLFSQYYHCHCEISDIVAVLVILWFSSCGFDGHYVYWWFCFILFTENKKRNQMTFLEEKNTPLQLDTPVKKEDQREPPMGQQSQKSSPRQPDVRLTSKNRLSHHPWASHLKNRHLGSKNHLNSHPWDNHPDNSWLREKTKNNKPHENKVSAVVVKNNSLKLERIKRQMKITLGIFFSHGAEEVCQ